MRDFHPCQMNHCHIGYVSWLNIIESKTDKLNHQHFVLLGFYHQQMVIDWEIMKISLW